ncbi:hypothetical protein HYC85_016097 [Camellia sinensis]|uniref:EamA domain-containing protein n=1 Tax=Camellia sinensis TaxID=4442 RepID=A0A7J7GYR9_CAMSI|nr:hypothetical protein HYC85_016097 [Camellia sinensis]
MGWRYKAGLFLILTVIIMWVSSAEVAQGIFEEYDHPFALAYLGTSLLVLYLPIAFIKDGLYYCMRCRSSDSSDDEENSVKPSSRLESPVKADEPVNEVSETVKEDGMELKSQEEGMVLDTEEINSGVDKLTKEKELNNKEMARLGLFIAPIWFITEYLTNAALARTSVASTMVLCSTSGLFTLFIGAFLRQDSINVVKVVSVVVSMAGVAMTTLGKTWSTDQSRLSKSTNGKHSLVGDLCALLSAMTYALFTEVYRSRRKKSRHAKVIWIYWIVHAYYPLVAQALGVVWTTPLVAALGVSLTIPLAMLADMVVHGQHYSPIYIIGSAQVFVGFVVAGFSDWFSQKLRLKFFN